MKDKVALITGALTGIGREATLNPLSAFVRVFWRFRNLPSFRGKQTRAHKIHEGSYLGRQVTT